jgi:tRNA-specific 2-thiouridylase
MKTKALVLYSGGLDSRLAIEILKQQNLEITALKFILPFGCTACQNFPDPKNIKIIELNVKKSPLLEEYLSILKNPQHGTGSGINPCKDCKIFMLKKAKEYADKNNIPIIATGEVLGQRPMSQTGSNLKIIDENLNFEILRPLSAKALPETTYEKNNLIDRKKLYGITGRGRKEQIKLAEKFKIKFPTPGGGCFLCEKNPAKRLNYLIKNNLITEQTLPLTTIGRHFRIDNTWLVVARNEAESNIINKFQNHLEDDYGKPAIYFSDPKAKQKALELQTAYSTGAIREQRDKFKHQKL